MTTIQSINELRKEFGRRGWNNKATGRIIFELFLHISIAISGMVLFVTSHSLALRALAICIASFGGMGVGTNTHTSTHYGTSDKRWVNEVLSYFGFPFFLGFSATYWWYKHVTVHHPSPNVMGVDTDADLLPWFATTVDEFQASSGVRRFYHKHLQFWLFPLMASAIYINMIGAGWRYLLGALFNSERRKTTHWVDLFSLLAHFGFWLALPLLIWPWQPVVAFFLLRMVGLGYAMYVVLAPGHLPEAARRMTPEVPEEKDFFTVQTEGSVSFTTGPIGRFLCSGLEYQVEHHLFPNISHIYYPQMSVIIQQFCREHGLSYRSYSWGTALWKSWEVMRCPQPVLGPDDIESSATLSAREEVLSER